MKTLSLFALFLAVSVPCCKAQNLLQRRNLQALGGVICVSDQPSLAPFSAQFNTARQMFTSEEDAAFQRYSFVAVRLGTQPPCFDKPFRVDVVGDQIIGVTYSIPGDAIACASQAEGELAVDPAGFTTVQGLFDITAAGATAVAANQTMGVLTRVCAQFDPATGAPLQVTFETDGTAAGWTISGVTSVPEPPAVNFTCGDTDVPVCGTDLQTYTNLCLLNVAQRFNPGLQQAAEGACPVPPPAS